MTRLCIIGNSHLGALRQAWDGMNAAHPDVALTFFGSCKHPTNEPFRLEHGALVPVEAMHVEHFRWTSGGATEIRFDEYDHFAVVDLRFRPQIVLQLGMRFSFIDARLNPSKRLISRDCFEQAVLDYLLGTIAANVARKIRAAAAKPVLMVAGPRKSAEVMATDEFRAGFRRDPRDCWKALREVWTGCATRAAASLDTALVMQPEQTIASEMFTHHDYCRGAMGHRPGAARAHEFKDLGHMNRDYGAAMLSSILGACAAPAAP